MKETLNFKSSELEQQELLKETTYFLNAGGRGTRLEGVIDKNEKTGISKALITLDGKPLIKWHIDHARKLGYQFILISAGDHSNVKQVVENESYGDEVKAELVSEQKGTGGDLLQVIKQGGSFGKYMLVDNVDSFVLLNEAALLADHKEKGLTATIVLTGRDKVPNQNAWTVDSDGKVLDTLESNGKSSNQLAAEKVAYRGSSTGVVIFNTEWLQSFQSEKNNLSIYGDMLPQLVAEGQLNAYYNKDLMFYDVGTPQSYKKNNQQSGFSTSD